MHTKEHLHLLIDEEIYIVETQEEPKAEQTTPKVELKPEPKSEEEEKTVKMLEFGFFHNNEGSEAEELLNKIIVACKFSTDRYQVFSDSSMVTSCKKAIIFTSKPKTYYQWLPFNEKTSIMYSLSLGQIANSQTDKAKLWKALQEIL